MSATEAVLRKKLRPRPPVRALSHAALEAHADELFRKTAKLNLHLDLVVEAADAARKSPVAAMAELPAPCLPLLTLTEGGGVGLFVLDGALVDGLIEQQTIGKVSPAPRVNRPVTAIDAALSEGFASAVLAQITKDLAEDKRANSVCGFTIDKMQTDPAALRLALTAQNYDILTVTLDLGPGVKTGTAQLWFPAPLRSAGIAAQAPAGWSQKLGETLSDVPLRLTADLAAIRIPLSQAVSLKVGAQLPIDSTVLEAVHLNDVRGKTVAYGKLGQMNGERAVRITALGKPQKPGRGGQFGAAAQQPVIDELPKPMGQSDDLISVADIDLTGTD